MEATIYTALAVVLWLMVPHFVPPFDHWKYTMHMQGIVLLVLFFFFTVTRDPDNMHYVPLWEWKLAAAAAFVVFAIYKAAEGDK